MRNRGCRLLVTVAAATGLVFSAVSPAHAEPAPDDGTLVGPGAEGQAPGDQPFSVGAGAEDSFAGYLPDGTMLSPFEDADNPVLSRVDPALLAAVQEATTAAAAEGVQVWVTSGWRSRGFQLRLFDDGVRNYGSVEAARQFVASPENSHHVTGNAIDVGPPEAARWMSRNGPRFGLCQTYANELWHYELAADANGQCPPMKPSAAAG